MIKHLYLASVSILLFVSCNSHKEEEKHSHHHANYVTQLKNIEKKDVGNGEFVYQMEGKDLDFQSLSFAITETNPGGGPPLHTHTSEEAHIVMDGNITYVIGDSIFNVNGPFVTKVPAGVPHTFINSGDTVINLIAVFPKDNFGKYNPVGKNPLIEKK
ncbi:cupin domain-containing protein [Owenweeksia hongkongensis]|uniref:cupin domain-containing protein n=1 Tax=Owenweeksia hongkongensis TaxID=253245 RepID=UPI003A95251A